ncbi:diguanylate cyclase domain-containing protein [Saccharothrix syringae]|uniref:Diguanylate cyclase n=1 Tax=Saccharothrix syringae TaxID=103733 RepID=A0A5Q0H7T6_SACSY|nr:diguanylate cyclase [Saccharothrix syringae]QFZ22308.1 diguanylate cyclase [Saccharothrix syringae]
MTQSGDPARAEGDAPAAPRPDPAEVWTRALSGTAYAPMARARIREHLERHLAHLARLLAGEPFDPDPGAAVGEWLVAARFTGPHSLQRTVEVLGRLLDGDPVRVTALLGAVAAGYVDAVRGQVFAEQEEVRSSLLAALERTRHDLHDSEARFRQVFASSAVGIAIFDADGAVLEANPALVAMLRPGGDRRAPFTDEDLAALRADQRRTLLSEEDVFRAERRFTGPDGDPMWTNVSLSVVRDTDGRPKYHVAVVEDTTEQRVLREYLRHQALHDVLTGLPNRQSFLPELERVLGRQGAATLCYLDVDGVGAVNDGLGYEAGDGLLRAVARRLTAVLAGRGATVARLGGDEFVVLLEGEPAIPSLAAGIRAALGRPLELAGRRVAVSAGMGFARTARGADAMALLRRAHSTLRRAERCGKGQWAVYDEALDARERDRLALAAALADALAGGGVNIDYLPVERDGERVAAAARLRWEDGDRGPVSHEDCLRLADEAGLGGQLSEWVLDEACAFAAQEGLPVLVSLSPDQSRDPDLTAPVADALRTSGLPPQRLWLGLAAGGLSADPDVVEDNLTTLADMGVRRLLHGFTCALPELSVVERHVLHGVAPVEPPREALAHRALAGTLPLVRATGALVVSDGRWPGADLVVRS